MENRTEHEKMSKIIRFQLALRFLAKAFILIFAKIFNYSRYFKIKNFYIRLKVYEFIHLLEIFGMKIYDCFHYSKKTLVIDIGAHKGVFSLYVSRKVKKIYAFEPVKENFEQLKKNLKVNSVENVRCLNIALSNFSGNSYMYIPIMTGSSSFKKRFGEIEKVRVKKLDEFIDLVQQEKNGNVIIKLDVEDSETEVIKGGTKFIKFYKPKIVAEIHSSESFSSLVKVLKSIGYNKFVVKNIFIGPIFYSTILCSEVN